jgi:hypothetical protein
VRGTVRFADGTPAAGFGVEAGDRDLRSEETLGRAVTDGGGAYRIDYPRERLRRAERGTADLVVRARHAAGVVAASPIQFNAPADAVVDLVIAADALRPPSLFQRLSEAVIPLLDGVALVELEEDERHRDLTFLAGETGFGRAELARFVQAGRLAPAAAQAEFWFALLAGPDFAFDESLGIEAQHARLRRALAGLDAAAAGKALAAAFARNDIDEGLRPRENEWIAAFLAFAARQALAGAGSGEPVLAAALDSAGIADPAKREAFASLHAQHGAMNAAMLDALAAGGRFKPAEVADLRASHRLAEIIGENVPAAMAIKQALGVKDPDAVRALARRSVDDWTETVRRVGGEQGIALARTGPDGERLSPAASARLDAELLRDRFRDAFPTAAFAGGLERRLASKGGKPAFREGERLLAFLDAHPRFELLSTPVDDYLRDNADRKFRSEAVGDTFVSELKAAQRVFKLAPSFEATEALIADGVHSAQRVYRLGESAFVRRYGGMSGFSAEAAAQAWSRAADTHAAVLTLVGDLQAFNREAMPAALANDNSALTSFPNWEALFKSGDLCACEECRSVLGPAAYFADLLNFLDDRGVQGILFDRRPDLGFVELSCENGHTPLPYVDIACEVMEAAITHGASDVNVGGLSALPAGTSAIRTALIGAGLRPGNDLSVEQIATSDRWVVHGDETTYLLHRPGSGSYRARILPNTKASAEELRAYPAYVDAKAYEALRGAAFPWSLPFDLFGEEVRAGFAKAGISRSELMRTLRHFPGTSLSIGPIEVEVPGSETMRTRRPPPPPPPPPAVPGDVEIAAEYFGIGVDPNPTRPIDELRLITAPAPTLASQQAYWGESANPQWLDYGFASQALPPAGVRLALVKTFLARTGLDYGQLLTLLDLPFIRGNSSVHVEHRDGSCDTDKKVVRGLDAQVLDRVHRFLRLWRKLGWKMWEVDLAIRNPGLGNGQLDGAFLVKLHALERLRKRLGGKTSLEEACALFDDLDTGTRFTEPHKPRADGLYRRLFLNRRLVQPLDEAFDVARVKAVAPTAETLGGHLPALLAGLRVTAVDLPHFTTLARPSDDTPYLSDDQLKLGNISFLWRHAWLARKLKLKPAEWRTALKLLQQDVAVFAHSLAALAFVERLDRILAGGFSLDQLDWLLTANRSAKAAPKPDEAAKFLGALRKQLQAIAAEFDAAQYPFLAPPSGDPVDTENLARLLTDLLGRMGRDEAATARILELLEFGIVAETPFPGMPPGFVFPAAITGNPNRIPIAYDATAQRLRLTRKISPAQKNTLLNSPLLQPLVGLPGYADAIEDLYEQARQARHALKYYDPLFTAPLDALPQGVDLQTRLPADLAARIRHDPDRRLLVFQGIMSPAEKDLLESLVPLGPEFIPFRSAVLSLHDQPDTIPVSDPRVWLKDVDLNHSTAANDTHAKRLALAASRILSYLPDRLSREAAIEKCGAALGLGEPMTRRLLTAYPAAGGPLLDDFLLQLRPSTGPVDESVPAMKTTIQAWLWARRVAALWKGWKLDTADVETLAALQSGAGLLDPAMLPVDRAAFDGLAAAAATAQIVDPFLRTAGLLRMRERLPETGIGFFTLLGKLNAGLYPTHDFAVDIAALGTGVAVADAEYLIGRLDLAFPTDYLRASTWERLLDAFGLIASLNADAAAVLAFARPAMGPAHAASLATLLRGKLGSEAWLSLSTEVQDVLRERKRDALVAFLLANPSLAPGLGAGDKWENANDLYAYFLIDVEMCSCQLTSRLVSASASVQLFVQRCLMGLERQVSADDETDSAWRWWSWMSKFRVWEANRRVFLWPENWIEPELKSDRSEFFRALETELQQNEINRDTVEAAFAAYLEKLDGVSQLEPAGFYQDDDGGSPVIHVFARTAGAEPHLYYYRRYDYRYWSPWEWVEGVDIQGDYLLPAVIGNRLYLFWPSFSEVPDEENNSEILTPQANAPATLKRVEKRLRMQLAMSDLRQGKWTAKRLSTDHAQSDHSYAWDIEKSAYNFWALDMASFKRGFHIYYEGVSLYTYEGQQLGTAPLRGAFEIGGCSGVPVATRPPIVRPLPREFPLYHSLTEFQRYQKWVETERRRDAPADDITLVTDYSVRVSFTLVLGRTPGRYRMTPSRQFSWFDRLRLARPEVDPEWAFPRAGTWLPFFYNDQQRTYFVLPASARTAESRMASNEGPALRYYPDLLGDLLGKIREAEERFPAIIEAHFPHATAAQKAAMLESALAQHRDAVGRMARDGLQSRKFHFKTFYHPFVCDFARLVNDPLEGIPGLMRRQTQLKDSGFSFGETYRPGNAVLHAGNPDHLPREDVDFTPDGAYSSYNWELFFHAPLLIANALSRNQRFTEADEWYRFIFNPLGVESAAAGGSPMSKFWITKPFFETTQPQYVQQRIDNILTLLADPATPQPARDELARQVRDSRDHPFDPHRIAGYRTVAYQKTVVMKYLDNLIAWGDYLFSQDSMESINEATQIYILAAEILGPKPLKVAPAAKPPVETYNELRSKLDDFSNALIQFENMVPVQAGGNSTVAERRNAPPLPMLYFCIPHNSRMLGYWDTVADRLYKIRHCMNIEGVVRQLALFEQPVDPGAMVKAVAGGQGVGQALADLNAPLPHYRFATCLQKANEYCNDVKALGSALLSALEKKDAETLGLLRQSQEIAVLEAATAVREQQLAEAKENLEGVRLSRRSAETRRDYYRDIEQLSSQERLHLDKLAESHKKAEIAQGLKIAASVISYIPFIDLGASGFGGTPLFKVGTGGMNLGQATSLAGDVLSFLSQIAANDAIAASSQAGFDRRWDDWKLQEKLAERELDQIDSQIAAAEIRVATAERELANHRMQIDNAKAVDEFMRSKYTGKDLIEWQIGRISETYFQSFRLALDLARRAERCFRFELGLQDSAYIGGASWDSLRKGLLAGERLQADLRRLEAAYLERNARTLELTKHISLALLDPMALIELRATGRCEFSFPEEIFTLDYPGHYARRIKAVRLTLPRVAGPYATVACTLRLTRNSVRVKSAVGDGYSRTGDEDDRFVESRIPVKAIATSSGQNDSGMFEFSFRDERYLPLEGAGVISDWILELFHAPDLPDYGRSLRQWDYDTLSDVIIHVDYVALEDNGPFRTKAIEHLGEQLASESGNPASLRLFSLRREFPSEWARFVDPAATTHELAVSLAAGLFRFMDKGQALELTDIWLVSGQGQSLTLAVEPPGDPATVLAAAGSEPIGDRLVSRHFVTAVPTGSTGAPIVLRIGSPVPPPADEELYLVVRHLRV